ncbi:MAG: hypothetical protein Q7J38_05925 [Gallionella sp.]|nr:hypothetical protein [Gallionella sp.]
MSPAILTDSPQKRLGDFAIDAALLRWDGFRTVHASDNFMAQSNGWLQQTHYRCAGRVGVNAA